MDATKGSVRKGQSSGNASVMQYPEMRKEHGHTVPMMPIPNNSTVRSMPAHQGRRQRDESAGEKHEEKEKVTHALLAPPRGVSNWSKVVKNDATALPRGLSAQSCSEAAGGAPLAALWGRSSGSQPTTPVLTMPTAPKVMSGKASISRKAAFTCEGGAKALKTSRSPPVGAWGKSQPRAEEGPPSPYGDPSADLVRHDLPEDYFGPRRRRTLQEVLNNPFAVEGDADYYLHDPRRPPADESHEGRRFVGRDTPQGSDPIARIPS